MSADSFGDRMKLYEEAARTTLPRRLPVIIRVDGKAFHTFTRGCARPFDDAITCAMDRVAEALCEQVQGAQMAYVQSDEVSVLVHGYKTFGTQPWFQNGVQKMVSIAASIATAAFNAEWWRSHFAASRVAYFDARAFVLPEADVCNYFIWRQQDAIRNSVRMLGRAHFSESECDGMSGEALKSKLLGEKGVRWDDLPVGLRRGRVAHWKPRDETPPSLRRRDMFLDDKPTIFTMDRDYIERHLALEPEDTDAR